MKEEDKQADEEERKDLFHIYRFSEVRLIHVEVPKCEEVSLGLSPTITYTFKNRKGIVEERYCSYSKEWYAPLKDAIERDKRLNLLVKRYLIEDEFGEPQIEERLDDYSIINRG